MFCNLADLHFADVLFANTGFDTAEKTSMARLPWSRTRSVFPVFRWRLFSRLFQCPRTTWIAWPRLEMGAQPCLGHRSVLSDGWRMGAACCLGHRRVGLACTSSLYAASLLTASMSPSMDSMQIYQIVKLICAMPPTAQNDISASLTIRPSSWPNIAHRS